MNVRRWSLYLVNLLLVAVSVSLPLAGLELYLRKFPQPHVPAESMDCAGALQSAREGDPNFAWDQDGNSPVHMRSKNAMLVYELRPNLRNLHGHVRTNRFGFRGPEFSTEKPADVFRICVLGDSVAFGWQEQEENTFPAQLERRLNEPAGQRRRIEVYNLAVGGYNAEQELEVLRTKAMQFKPDLILVAYCANDNEVGSDAGLWAHFSSTGSKSLDLVKWRLRQVGDLLRKHDIVERSYLAMKQFADSARVPIAVIFIPPSTSDGRGGYMLPELVHRHIAFASQIGLRHLDLWEAFQARGIAAIFVDGVHPNAAGYALGAEKTAAFLESSGLLAANPA